MRDEQRASALALDVRTKARLHVEAAARGVTVAELVELALAQLPPAERRHPRAA
jgi:hypothetical protein